MKRRGGGPGRRRCDGRARAQNRHNCRTSERVRVAHMRQTPIPFVALNAHLGRRRYNDGPANDQRFQPWATAIAIVLSVEAAYPGRRDFRALDGKGSQSIHLAVARETLPPTRLISVSIVPPRRRKIQTQINLLRLIPSHWYSR